MFIREPSVHYSIYVMETLWNVNSGYDCKFYHVKMIIHVGYQVFGGSSNNIRDLWQKIKQPSNKLCMNPREWGIL